MLSRMIRAMRLDPSLFEEVEASPAFSSEAFLIVLIVSILSGVFAILFQIFVGGTSNIGTFLFYPLLTWLGYLTSILSIWVVGVGLFGGKSTLSELQRTIGFAQSPNIFAGIPCFNILVLFWGLAVMFVAVRQTLNLSNGKSFFAILIAGFAQIILYVLLAALGLAGAMFVSSGF